MGDPLSTTTRVTLIQRIRDTGDRLAWDEFCRVYQPMVRTYVRRFHVQDHDADDLVQDVFARLREQMPRFVLDHARGKFRGWLRLVTDNTVRDWLRAEARADRIPRELAERFAADDDEQERRRQTEWRRAVLDTVLAQVREEFNQGGEARRTTFACFEMATLQNRPAKEVAAELGIGAVNNVYVYAHRVLQRVRNLCEEYDENLDEGPLPPAAPRA